MYNHFFGFKERPFQLVPNPAYLFLSRSHEEAMAHLKYAISQGDGFVEITGEVGTGKTTLCRAFIEDLGHDVESAYIFNPMLDALQLLKAINDEFEIQSQAETMKGLIDSFNAFLMEKKGQGKRVILIIDEAQNLSKEVLEQVRLLSNLETTTSKLLQIILVGQPELGEMLDSYELRQLGQRISLSCHLMPLTRKETTEYIQHRIRVASQRSGVQFTRAALRCIYGYSGGTPRLINIACDRALLMAFGVNRHKITGGIARASIRELAGRGETRRYSFRGREKTATLLAALCMAVLLGVLYLPRHLNTTDWVGMRAHQKQGNPSLQDSGSASHNDSTSEQKTQMKAAPIRDVGDGKGASGGNRSSEMLPTQDLGVYLKNIESRTSRAMALKSILSLWRIPSGGSAHLEKMEDDQVFFQSAAKRHGLLLHRMKKNMELVKRLNLPAALEFHVPGERSPRYMTLMGIKDEKIRLCGMKEGEIVESARQEVELYWTGVTYILWKDFLNYTGTIPFNAPRDSIIALKMLIQDLGFNHIEISPSYDELTSEAVKTIQAKHGLEADGVVGPLTKMILYNEKKSLEIPHIRE